MDMEDDQPIDYEAGLAVEEAAEASAAANQSDVRMRDVDESEEEESTTRPLRSGQMIKLVNDSNLIIKAPIILPMNNNQKTSAANTNKLVLSIPKPTSAASKRKTPTTSPVPASGGGSKKRKEVPDDDTSGGTGFTADGKFQGPVSTSHKLRMSRQPQGAAIIHSSTAVPPVGSFVNMSEGMASLTPEVTQFPYTGPVLKKAGSAAGPTDAASNGKIATSVIVPSFAAWFDLSNIHEIERASLPEFFDATVPRGKKVYKDTRNFIIQSFRQNPRAYLSLTSVRKLVTGDACSLQRIHSFLESWGLINFHVDPGSLPSMTSPGNFQSSYPLLSHSAYTGFSPIIQTRQSKDVLQHLIHHQAHPGGHASLRRSVLLGPSTHLSHEPLQTEFGLRRDPSVPLTCRKCQSTNVENVRYVCRQKRDYILCADCFFGGKYDHLLSSADFERYLQDEDANATDAERSGEWSREEVFRLLQGISMHEDDWESVSDHVRTRTKDECCLKFVQLPIEEPFLDQYYNNLTSQPGQPTATSLIPSGATAAANAANLAPSAGLASIPFAEAPNPILSQVAFLASYVSPSVAAAGAQAALTYCSIQDMAGQVVRTPFGVGHIVVPGASNVAVGRNFASANSDSFSSSSFTRPDGILTIQLPWARLYAHASQISIIPNEPTKEKEKEKRKESKEPVWTKDLISLSGHVLQSAARKSVELAEEEERKVLRFVAQLTGALSKRIEMKLNHLDELESWMQSHKNVYDASASAYYEERMKQQAAAAAEAATAKAAAATAAASSTPVPMDITTKQEPSTLTPSPQTPMSTKPVGQLPTTYGGNQTPTESPFRIF